MALSDAEGEQLIILTRIAETLRERILLAWCPNGEADLARALQNVEDQRDALRVRET